MRNAAAWAAFAVSVVVVAIAGLDFDDADPARDTGQSEDCEPGSPCWAEMHQNAARAPCRSLISAEMPGIEFTHGFGVPFWKRWNRTPDGAWAIVYSGDAANLDGVQVAYSCRWNADRGLAEIVRLEVLK